MENNFGRAWAEIDLNRLKGNIAAVRGLVAPSTMIMAVVKANAYGHGMCQVAQAAVAAGADWLAVATVAEGVALRKGGIGLPILVMGACFNVEMDELLWQGLTATVFSLETGRALSARAGELGLVANVHAKIDTGMNRLGFREDFLEVLELAGLPNLLVEGICSHFAISDGCGDFTLEQFERFMAVVKTLEDAGLAFSIKHISNSGAVLNHPEFSLDMVRVGVLMYGLAPCSSSAGADYLRARGILPVLDLKSRVAHVKMIRAGESVGYGREFVAREDMEIATIAMGYGDGISRGLSGRGHVLINGLLCPIVGTVCMDQLMVASVDAQAGDEVVFIGDGLSSEDVADWQDSINYEVVTAISQRVQRIYKI